MASLDRPPTVVRVGEVRAPERPWSATAIDQFHGCPLRYWWQRIERWETPSTAPLVIGRAVHSALEELLALPPEDRRPERAEEFLARAVEEELEMAAGQGIDEDAVRAGSAAALEAYWLTESPDAVEVAPDGLERKVEADLAGLPFLGHIDRVAVVDAGLRVTDYKTGAPKPRYWWGYWRQQLLYAAALAELGDPVAEVELLYLSRPRAVRRPVYAAALTRAIADLETAHEQRDRMCTDGAWEARTGPLCRYCDFRLACPAQRPGAPTPGSPESDELLRTMGLVQRAPDPATPRDLLDILDDEVVE